MGFGVSEALKRVNCEWMLNRNKVAEFDYLMKDQVSWEN
jgi:hypothetical protein